MKLLEAGQVWAQTLYDVTTRWATALQEGYWSGSEEREDVSCERSDRHRLSEKRTAEWGFKGIVQENPVSICLVCCSESHAVIFSVERKGSFFSYAKLCGVGMNDSSDCVTSVKHFSAAGDQTDN